METRKLQAALIALSISFAPGALLAQTSTATKAQGADTNAPNTITSPNDSRSSNSTSDSNNVNRTRQGNVNPSIGERTIPDVNNTNPTANDNLSEPRNNTDGAIVGNNSNNINYSRDTWRQVQEKLNDSNFPVGNADGMSGPRTTEAIKNYQRSQNIEVTGRLNQETLDRMDIDYSNDVPANQRLSE